MPRRDQHSQLSRARASFFCGIVATLLVCSLCPVILSGYLQPSRGSSRHAYASEANSGRHLLRGGLSAARVAYLDKLHHVHGWLMCISWGCLIPLGVVIACFRTVRGSDSWWFHLHRILALLGFLISVAGLAVGVYLDPGVGGLFWQHKIIGIVVNVLALVQVAAGLLIKPPNTSNLRRVWNLTHWTLGRSALALGIANIFIGMYLSSDAYKNIIAQAVVLGGFYIIVMLKNDLEYLLVGCTPAEEEERLKAAHVIGSQKDLGQTAFSALANGKGPARKGKGKSKDEARTTGDPILDTGNSTLEMIPASGAETIV